MTGEEYGKEAGLPDCDKQRLARSRRWENGGPGAAERVADWFLLPLAPVAWALGRALRAEDEAKGLAARMRERGRAVARHDED
jgi:hypothetical protein